jgi:hypothetical protein
MSEAITYPIRKFDANGNKTYWESSTGIWHKYEFDADGKLTKWENSYGQWYKWEFDADGNETYFEDSDGYWIKAEFDADGNETYFEDSDGIVRGVDLTPIIAPQRYNHAFTIGFEVISENPKGATNEEIISGLEKRLNILKNNPDEIQEATDIYDTFELE